jgi:hypothetical protein
MGLRGLIMLTVRIPQTRGAAPFPPSYWHGSFGRLGISRGCAQGSHYGLEA